MSCFHSGNFAQASRWPISRKCTPFTSTLMPVLAYFHAVITRDICCTTIPEWSTEFVENKKLEFYELDSSANTVNDTVRGLADSHVLWPNQTSSRLFSNSQVCIASPWCRYEYWMRSRTVSNVKCITCFQSIVSGVVQTVYATYGVHVKNCTCDLWCVSAVVRDCCELRKGMEENRIMSSVRMANIRMQTLRTRTHTHTGRQCQWHFIQFPFTHYFLFFSFVSPLLSLHFTVSVITWRSTCCVRCFHCSHTHIRLAASGRARSHTHAA